MDDNVIRAFHHALQQHDRDKIPIWIGGQGSIKRHKILLLRLDGLTFVKRILDRVVGICGAGMAMPERVAVAIRLTVTLRPWAVTSLRPA